MKTLEGWVTLPMAADRWGVTRGRVWRLVSEQMEKLPASVVTRAGDRWMLDPEFVSEVERRVKASEGRFRLDAAIREVAALKDGA